MTIKENERIQATLQSLRTTLVEMQTHAPFDKSHIDKLTNLLDDYLTELEQVSTKDDALKLVERTVNAINTVNEDANEEMIETMEREDIAEVINYACVLKGYAAEDDDLTEDYRDW